MVCTGTADEAADEVLRRTRALLLEPAALKRLLGGKSPVRVRIAAYNLIALLSRRCAPSPPCQPPGHGSKGCPSMRRCSLALERCSVRHVCLCV